MRKDIPHESYTRLLLAAKKLRGWNGDAEIIVGCSLAEKPFPLSAARIGNWRRRGVAMDSMLDVCRIIGVRPLWIRDGTGTMEDIGVGVSDPDIQEAIEILSGLRGRLRTKAVGILGKEVRQLQAEDQAAKAKIAS